jgi:hypothetical protein
VILLDDNLATLPDLLQNGVKVARQFRFADVQCGHTSDHKSSSPSSSVSAS